MKKLMMITLLVFSLVGISWYTWAWQTQVKQPLSKAALKDSVFQARYDAHYLRNFTRLFKHYDTLKTNYTIAGRISVIDLADTTEKMDRVPFLFCKNGNAFYYKIGTTETINAEGVYLYIDHSAKNIILSVQKGITMSTFPMADMAKTLRAEEFEMAGKSSGSLETVTLNNPHHISCKEYVMTYDTTTWELRRMHAKLTNSQQPLTKGNEKLVEINFSQWNDASRLDRYLQVANVIHKSDGNWKLNAPYAGYELIQP